MQRSVLYNNKILFSYIKKLENLLDLKFRNFLKIAKNANRSKTTVIAFIKVKRAIISIVFRIVKLHYITSCNFA